MCLAFGQVLRHNSCVTWLDLSDNLLGEKGADVAQEITRALAYNVTLKHLDLAKNRMGPELGRWARQWLTDRGRGLLGQWLSWRGCVVWCRAMAAALMENRTLLSVDLRNNRFDATVGEALVPMLHANNSILTLHVSGASALHRRRRRNHGLGS